MPTDNGGEHQLTPQEKEFFEAGLKLSLEDRYALLGRAFPERTPDGRRLTLTRIEAAARGRKLFKEISGKLRQTICMKWDYCNKRHDPRFKNRWTLIQALLPLVAAVVGDGVGATTAILILLGIGMDKFCDCK